jgi:MmeI, DNA-methyltransferase domain/MmeI, target recognition domain/MmeI, N-terminal domain/MmeI, helicase spacer domain/MmeI, C-terminal domain
MNPVEIEEAVSQLAEEPFEREEFPFQFLTAFGNKKTTIDRLRKGATNQSDVENGVLQRSNIHIATCAAGRVAETLTALRESPKTASQKAKFIVATDGDEFQAEDVQSGETVACDYPDFADHFGFFLPLAGITTVEQIRENAVDIKATGRLNKLYVQLRNDNPEWEDRREDMNHFMARLIFCFFAEDTDIFHAGYKFTETVERMTSGAHDITHEVIGELFRAMNTKHADRNALGIKTWAGGFPYVNGELFSGSTDVPYFSKIARSYLIHIGNLDWTKINPDIFGSMIQAVADDEERGALGMHYTSVPNILKVLNPLFLDDLRAKLEEAGDNIRKLANLRGRMAKIRVFDPACGSGNFLVIAYKQMREIEAEINRRRGEPDRKTDIPKTNFRGIELRDFPAEIARLALIIAEYQCDVLYRGQKEALAEFLPLDSRNWITCGNALRLDWLSICPPTGTGVKVASDDLFETPLDQSEIDFENAGGETYICGNPPYLGSTWQDKEQKSDLERIFSYRTKNWKSLDYVAAWFMLAADYGERTPTVAAFVATNSICQGQQVPILWPLVFDSGAKIALAHTSFKWANLASNKAGVTVVIVGISRNASGSRLLFSEIEGGETIMREGGNISPYLLLGPTVIAEKSGKPLNGVHEMTFGSKPVDGGNLLLSGDDLHELRLNRSEVKSFVRRIYGSEELINGKFRHCLWIDDEAASEAREHQSLGPRLLRVEQMRLNSSKAATQRAASWPHRFDERRQDGGERVIAVAAISSENREYIPCGLLPPGSIISNKCYALFDAPLWNMAIVASRLHWVWIGAVCVRLEMRFSYSNTLGWNTFPLPKLTEQNKADLTRCAENILLAREAHFPATIADLYDPDEMPEDLRRAHEENDEVLERIYIGRRFRNDTERLEKLFELYTKMTGKKAAA